MLSSRDSPSQDRFMTETENRGPTMTSEHWWKISLRLKLRQTSGDRFQDFFSDIMEKLHGSDYVRIRPFGRLGDKGCDGYLTSSGIVFQCYGALNGDRGKVAYLVSKMQTDFSKAQANLTGILKEWKMVHNLVDGLPIDAIEALQNLKDQNPSLNFAFFGLEAFEVSVNSLTDDQKMELFEPAATNIDAQNLQVEELRTLIEHLVQVGRDEINPLNIIEPVSQDKLNSNELPNYWHTMISSGWRNAHLVGAYFINHYDPERGEQIATMFRSRYQYLKSQQLEAGSIMDNLYEFVTGIGTVLPARQVAAQALLSYLFESCDIFENTLRRD